MSMSRGGRWSPKSMSFQSLPPSPAMTPAPSYSTDDYFSKTPTSSTASGQSPHADALYAEPESYDSQSQSASTPSTGTPTLTHRMSLTESEKKRVQLQARLWKACTEVPANVVIRVFHDPQECVEASQVIDPHLARESN
jgi:hypothetical protein